MVFRNTTFRKILLIAALGVIGGVAIAAVTQSTAQGTQTAPAQAPSAKSLGTIKSISGNTITLTTDSGDVAVVVQDGAKLVRIAPGQKDLRDAVPIQLQELLPGDRILVRGKLADDWKSVLAVSVIAMKKADITEKQAHEREEWQKHGTGGLVSGVDPGANTILISLPAAGEKKNVTIHVSKETILRRYAPDSIKFDDAKPAPLEQIKTGDQLRARGTRSADGNELNAEEIVSGTFRNIAGTISSIDASANSITLQDLATKKIVTVKVTGDSQVRKLPPQMAQRVAARLKGISADAPAPGAAASANANAAQGQRAPGPPTGGTTTGGPGGAGRNAGGSGDLQQAISRMPAATLAELQKGEAVMIVATEIGPNGMPWVITLLAGVEPILEASPNSSASSILSPWSLGSAPGGEGNP